MSEEKKYELKPGTFTMFKVDPDKKKKENSPDFNGTAKLSEETLDALRENGGMLRLSGWGKVSNGGKVYVSGFIEEQKEFAQDKPPQEAVDQFMVTPAIAKAQESDVQDAEVVSDDLPF